MYRCDWQALGATALVVVTVLAAYAVTQAIDDRQAKQDRQLHSERVKVSENQAFFFGCVPSVPGAPATVVENNGGRLICHPK
jgi:hypothetical protein